MKLEEFKKTLEEAGSSYNAIISNLMWVENALTEEEFESLIADTREERSYSIFSKAFIWEDSAEGHHY